MKGRTRPALSGILLLLLPGVASCYQPRPLDARAIMNEVAEESQARGEGKKPRASVTATGTAAAQGLTEDQAVALALRANPDLRAARRQRGIAEGEIVAAGALANPTVGFDVLHLQDNRTGTAQAITLGWDPPQPWIYAAGRASARAGADAVAAEIAEAEWQLAISVRGAHAGLLAVAEERVLVGKGLEVRRKITELVTRRVSGGASTRLDLSLAQLAVSQAETLRDDLAAQQIAAAQALGQLLGTEASPPRAVGALSDQTTAPPPLEVLVESALASRPAVTAEEQRFLQKEQNLRLEHARRWPWFRFTAIPRYRNDSTDAHPSDYAVGVQLTLPILNQNGGGVQIAEGLRDQERESFRKLVSGIRRELGSARDEIVLRNETVQRYQTAVLPGLDAHERLLGIALSGGQVDVVALLTAQDAILRNRRDYVGMRLGAYRARLKLERAIGPRERAK
ncbi:MAG TPA: TolC family protein [Polyangia bacterium]|nr:TolC family protein [Polyangia bacterium]